MAHKSTMLFDAMNNILVTKSEKIRLVHIADPNFRDFTKFMCLKYMTMSPDPRIRELVVENYVALERMPSDAAVYKWLMDKLPKQRSGFIRYIR